MQNKQRFMVEGLALLLTVITLFLGNLMYFSNLKNTRQNLIGVELADFIYNTNYSMQFGKKIETFYGMQDDLQELKDTFEDVDELYIVSAQNDPLFSTTRTQIPERVVSMPAGSNLNDGEYLYCMYAINDDARILTVSGITEMRNELKQYFFKLVKVALIGILVVLILIRIVWKAVPARKKAYRLAAAVPVVWIVLFSAMTGVDGYREYDGSTQILCDNIGESVDADIKKVEALGIAREDLYQVDSYLKRYTDVIPEVEEITLADDDTVSYKMSVDYQRKMYLDYILQTVLLLTFSILILAECQFFITNTGTLAEE